MIINFELLKKDILHLIKHSVVNSTTTNGYSVYSIGDNLSAPEYILSACYSHTDAFDVWNKYEIYPKNMPPLQLILPMNIDIDDQYAKDFLMLFKKCSDKVKAQENMAQHNMFLRTVIINHSGHMH